MIEYVLISTPSVSARRDACSEGRTLKPTRIASEAVASNTSLSVIAPTPFNTMLIAISSVDNFWSESLNASTDPSTSPLMIRLSCLKFPRASLLPISSSVICFLVLIPCSRSICALRFATSLASASS